MPPLTGRGRSSTSRSTTASARWSQVAPGGRRRRRVRIWSRLGNDKTAQFPSSSARCARSAARAATRRCSSTARSSRSTSRGGPPGFQRLQGRIHLAGARDVERVRGQRSPVALIAFDLLRDGDDDLRGLPLTDAPCPPRAASRRARTSDTLRLSEQVAGDGTRALRAARARRLGRAHRQGRRVALPLRPAQPGVAQAETRPTSRSSSSAAGPSRARRASTSARCCSGVYEADDRTAPTRYVGPHRHRLRPGGADARLEAAEAAREHGVAVRRAASRPTSAALGPARAGRAGAVHGVDRRPEAPASRLPRTARRQGAADGRDDEAHFGDEAIRLSATSGCRRARRAQDAAPRSDTPGRRAPAARDGRRSRRLAPVEHGDRPAARPRGRRERTARSSCPTARASASRTSRRCSGRREADQGRSAPLLRDGRTVHPAGRRGPAAGDEALPERRRRAGVLPAAQAPEQPPAGVRIESSPPSIEPASEPDCRRFIGGSLITLLYMTQIAAISQDPWFSRVQSPLDADYVALDLDPDDDAPFARVLDVARWVRDELESLKVPAVPKTSGSSRPAHLHPAAARHVLRIRACSSARSSRPSSRRAIRKVATVERKVQARGARNGLRGLPAEHPGQDARDRLQRARERVRRRLDAARVEGARREDRSAGLHDPDRAAAFPASATSMLLHGPTRVDLRDALARLARP